MICRICDGDTFDLIIDLGDQPWGNGFLKPTEYHLEKVYPLQLLRCQTCTTAQLSTTVPKEVMFIDHTYLSGTTKSLNDHFKSIAENINCNLTKSPTDLRILDIGSNDGTFLSHFKNLGFDVLGVESSTLIAKIANRNGISTLNKFFNLETAEYIDKQFDFIHASGVFFHLEELHSATKGIKKLLKKDGTFIVQFIYMKSMQDNVAFDQIYHEHLLYYTLRTIQQLLERHSLELYDAEFNPIHGGSIIGYIAHKGLKQKTKRLLDLEEKEEIEDINQLYRYQEFSKNIEHVRENTLSWVDSILKTKKKVYGLGAPVKGNTLLNYFKLSTDKIDFLVERNSLRKGLYSPGMHIPVILEDEVSEMPGGYLVLAWNFKNEILNRYKVQIDSGVDFYFPISMGKI